MLTKFTQFPQYFQVLCNQSQMLVISLFVMFSFLASITVQQSTYQLMISTTTSMASTRSNYTFQIVQEDDVNLTSNTAVQIVFPTDYQGVIANGNYDCYVASWIDSVAIPSITCSLSGLTMSISGGFVDLAGTVLVSAYTFYEIVINQLTNPMYAVTTGAFTGLFQNTNTNSAIFNFQTNFGISGISISEGLLTCSLTASPATTTTSSAMILAITAPLLIPYNTSLTISLPVYWPTNAVNISTIISSASCQAIENVSSSIQCTMVTKPTAIQINVINLVSADTSFGIKFSVSSISNPPTTEPQGSINIVAKKDGTKSMARCSGAKMTGITPISFYSASFIVDNYSVNALTSGFLVFKVNSLVIVTDTIQIQFPPTLQALNVLSYINIPNGNSIDYSPSVTYNTSTQVTKVITKGASAVAGATIEIQFYNIKNPPSEATTSSMTLTLKRNGYPMEQLNTLSNPLAFKARRGAITGSVSSTTTEVGQLADYTFILQFSNDITGSNNSLILIYLPTLFSGAITNTSSCVPSCISLTSTTATFLASSISSLSSTSLSCTLKLTGLLNPLQIGLTTSFRVITQLYHSNSLSIVDQISSGLSMNLTSRQITTIGISSDSAVVYHYPTTLTISATNNNPIPAYSSLFLIVPSSITIQQASISCLLGTRSVPCTYNSANNSISVTSISATSIQSGQLQTLSISNLFNPPSTVPTSSFKFYIVNQFNQIIEHKQSGLTFQATSAAKFTSISISPSSTTNSDANTSIYIGFSLPMQAGYTNSSVLAISFPALMNNIASTTCVSATSNLISVTCTKSGNQVQATLTYSSTVTAGSEAGFRVQYYQNYPSIETYNIQLTLYTSVLQQFLIAQDSVTKVNTILSSIFVNSFAFSNGILSESTALTLSITPTYSGAELNQIFITFPNEFTISGGGCSSLPNGLVCGVSGNIFTISRSSVSYTWIMPLQLSLSGIIAPSFTPSTSLIIQTLTTSGYLISRDMSIKFSTACTLPCRTCPNGNTTSCQSCYSNPVLVSSKTMLDMSTSQCLAACANKYYFSNSTSQCEACSSNCELCVSFSYCTSCPSSLLLYRINNTCVSTCPFGYYGSSFFTCELCSTTLHCGSCSNEFQCLTCSSGYYFYQNLCLQNCPSPISFTNTILNTCDSCPTNCTKCAGALTVSNSTVACTECQPSYFLDTSTQRCYQQCLIPGTVPNGNQCVSCQAPCLTCAVSASNCTSCDTSSINKYLNNYRCLSICPSLYYASDSNYTCVLCTSPCQTCTSGSISSCLTCISSYFLYNNTCTQTCPNLYYPNAYQCTACVAPCLNCISQLQCTSCISGKYLYGSSCVSACDPGMTVINGNECLVCASSCKTCSSANYCTSCYPTNYLFNGTCSILCPNGTYRDSASQTCLACNNPCSQCSSTSYCITCIDPLLYTESGNCVSLCSGNLIPINSVCTACLANCLTCASTINNCIRCENGYYYTYGSTLPNCVSNCSNGYIFNNVTNTGNNQCLSSCPLSYYAAALGTNCLACLTGCTTCTNSQSNCSFCASSYYLYSSNTTCLLSCPADAPYATFSANSNISNTCSICNMSVCLTCDILHSCRACSSPNILVYDGLYSISSYKTCVGSCPSNSSYNITQMLCIIISNNATNNSNSTQNSTVSTNSNVWKYKLIPNYLFAFILLGMLPILGISKFQVATTNLKVSFYVICALLCAGVTAHVLYFQATEILGITKLSSSSTSITLSSLSISVQNPTTIIGLLILGTHIIATLILLLGLVIIRDYSLIPVISQHPIISFFLLLIFIVEYKALWILHCGIFGIQIFMVKYCKQAMVRLLKVITFLGLIQFILDIIYAIFVIIYTATNISGARLLLSSSSIPTQIGYLHPYIELTIMSVLCLFTSIVLLLTKRQQYFIEEVPQLDNGLLHQNEKTKISKLSEVNQSMNELLSEKDAAQRRFSNSDMYKEIDDHNHILSDEDNLYDFGLKTKYNSEVDKEKLSKVPSRISKISQKTNLSKFSKLSSLNQKLEKKEVAEVNIQVNMDQLMLPRIQEEQVLSNKNNVEPIQGDKQKANKDVASKLLESKTQQKKQSISSGLQQHFASKERKEIIEDKAQQQNIIKQQKQQQAKSQPSWSSFKLGSKYKQEIEQESEHIGFDKESIRSNSKSKGSAQMMRKDEGMRVYMFDQEEQSVEQVSDWEQKEQKIQEQSSYQQSMRNYKDKKIQSNKGNLDDRLVIKKNSQSMSVQSRNIQQQYQQQIQLTKNMPNLYQQSEQPSQQSISKHQYSLQSQQSQYQLQKQLQEHSQLGHEDGHQQLLEQDIISEQSSNIKSNIFYCEQPNNQQLLSENVPDEYRVRPPTQQSAAFVPFHDQDSCLIQDSLQEQDINVYLNIDMDQNEENLSGQKESNEQKGQNISEQKIRSSRVQSQRQQLDNNSQKKEQLAAEGEQKIEKAEQKEKHTKQQEQIQVFNKQQIRQSQKKNKEIKKQFNIEAADQSVIGAHKQIRQQNKEGQISQSHKQILQKQMMKKNKNPQSMLARLKAKRAIRNPIEIADSDKNDTLKESIGHKSINTDNKRMIVMNQAQNRQDQQEIKGNRQESIKNSVYKPISVAQSSSSKFRKSERNKINQPPQRDINKSQINNSRIQRQDHAELIRETEQKEIQYQKQINKKNKQSEAMEKTAQKKQQKQIDRVKKDQEGYPPLQNQLKEQKQQKEYEIKIQKEEQKQQQQYIQQQKQEYKQKYEQLYASKKKQLNQNKQLTKKLQDNCQQKQKSINQQNKSKLQERGQESKSSHQQQKKEQKQERKQEQKQEQEQKQQQKQQQIIYVEQQQVKQDQKMKQNKNTLVKIEQSEKKYEQFKETIGLSEQKQKKISIQMQNKEIYNNNNQEQYQIKQSQKSKNKQLSNNKNYIELELDQVNHEQSDLSMHTKERNGEDKNLISDRINKIKHRQQRSQILSPLKNEVKEPEKKMQQALKKPKYHIQPQTQDNATQIVALNNKIKEKKKIQIEYDDAEHYQIKNNANNNKQLDFIYRTPSQMGASLIYVPDDQQVEDQIDMEGQETEQKEYKEEQKEQKINDKQQPSKEQLQKQEQKPKQKGITFIQDLQQLDEMVKTPIRTIGKTRKNASSMMNKQIIEQSDIKPSEYIINNKIRNSIKREDQLMDINSNSYRQYYNNSESTNRNIFTNRQLHNQTQQKQSKNRIKNQSRDQKDGQPNKMPIGIIYEEEDTQYADNYQANKNKNNKSRDKTASMNHNKLYQYQSLNSDNNDKPSKSSNKNNRYKDVEKADKKPSLMLRGSFKKIGEHILKGDHQN